MSAAPSILAFDTSGPWCGAALMIDGQVVAQRHEEMARGQAERLMPMLLEVMSQVGVAWDDLDAIGVGVGPGNFTGIRVGVAAARGLALGLDVPAIGVSAFDAVRHLLDGEDKQGIVVLPAPRGQWLWQIAGPAAPPRMGLLPQEDFVCHCGHLDAPALIEFSAEEPTEHYEIDGEAIDCNAPATELWDVPAKMAPAIAKIAVQRLASRQPIPRPAPLYIRPADAAPPSDPAPVILP